jgi:hypothetical protein
MPVAHMSTNMARMDATSGESQVTRRPRRVKEGSESMAVSIAAVSGALRSGRSAVVPRSSTYARSRP